MFLQRMYVIMCGCLSRFTGQRVQFTLTDKELGFYNNRGKFVVEPGAFDVMVGGSSVEVLEGEFVLE